MKKSFPVLFLLFTIMAHAQTEAPLTKYDITRYSVDIYVDDESDTIEMGVMVFYRLVDPNCKEIILSLYGYDAQTGKGMKVNSVTCSSLMGPVIYRQTPTQVIVAAQKDSAKQWFYMKYRGIAADGMVIGKNKFGDRTFFSDNWPDRAPHWLACVNAPGDKASFIWSIEAPEYYTVTANGILTMESYASHQRKTWIFIQDEPIAVKVAAVGVARLNRALAGETGNCVPVYKYYYPQTATNHYWKFDAAMDILRFYSQLIGDYPFKKLAHVQSTTAFGGMENAGNIFYDENQIDNENNVDALVAHETAHQWFGNTVTEKSYAHLWLSEGFATFLTNYYLEKKYGTDTLKKRLKENWRRSLNFSQSSKRPVVDNTANYMSLLNANSYEKGGLFLQAIRERTGDSIFISILRTYFAKYKYKNADTEDFRAVVESITKKDWKAFFTDWLHTPILPEKYRPKN